MKNKTKILFILVACILSLVSVQKANAQANTISVSPVIIDEKGYARDIIKKTLTLTNNTNRKLNVYAFVQDIEPTDGATEYKKVYGGDVAESLANWIEFQRSAIELGPGETKEVPLRVQLNFRAEPGRYHAQIGFAHGSSVPDAERKGYSAVTLVNMEVLEDIQEFMQVNNFAPEKTFFSGSPVSFDYELENTGNKDLVPEGEIIFYNRRGKEVAAIPLNTDRAKLAAGNSSGFAAEWTSKEKTGSALASIASGGISPGRYKAVLRLKYGNKQPQIVQDTTFFWVVPWHFLLGLFITLSGVVIFMVNRWHKRLTN